MKQVFVRDVSGSVSDLYADAANFESVEGFCMGQKKRIFFIDL